MRARLAAAIERLRPVAPGVAWVAAENLHVTLKFLGGVDEARVPAIVEALAVAAARTPAFDLGVRGLGAFPGPGRPRVLWVGTASVPPDVLPVLAASVEAALAGLGFSPETRAFQPHVTLGRAREPRRNPALAEALARPAEFGAVAVRHVSLMRSDLHPRGARYTELAALPLA